jgi:post-segregation antitoxin (ccd killing protein)
MSVRLNITMDPDLYERLKRELPAKGISRFINEAVRAHLQPNRTTLDASYRAASKEGWRRELAEDWDATETEGWPR